MAKVGTRAKGQFRSINPMHLESHDDDADDANELGIRRHFDNHFEKRSGGRDEVEGAGCQSLVRYRIKPLPQSQI